MSYKILEIDPYLMPFSDDIELRMENYKKKRREILRRGQSISDFANGYEYFGIHTTERGWVYREWAPGADAMYFTGDFCSWDIYSHLMRRLDGGVFEIELDGHDTLKVGDKIQAIVCKDGQTMRRVPSYATRVVQDSQTYYWCAEVDDTLWDDFVWDDADFRRDNTPLIYECHIGMAQEEYAVGTYRQFREKTLPRIKALGYNTIQIMAIMEHPYYGSFGYQVSNFFAASSRYGSSRELKELIREAHRMGIAVLLDVVHSHAVKNTNEGLNLFDGTEYQYFHAGGKGEHSAWDTKLFNYGKNEVIHFLLSNLKYWMKIFHFDGFRFDGVTSMLYHDHGLGSAFTGYDMYFSLNTDVEAITYLQLANELIHEINKNALTVAEDMSGMPGMCIAVKDGGIGFDYRLSMGMPDLWIKLIKEYKDDDWDMWKIWYELNSRRPKEKNIGYCESHDQALVGDKTIMFRLCDSEMYSAMNCESQSLVIERGIALHKMIRLLTATTAGEGYLNFMGNEFGHPEWIDFPREGNGWSYHYCRRQWSLCDADYLRYKHLYNFDREMIGLLKREDVLALDTESRWIGQDDKVIIYSKGQDLIFAFNFDPTRSYEGYFVPVLSCGEYEVILSSDSEQFGGKCRAAEGYKYKTEIISDGRCGFMCYLPQRCAVVFKKVQKKRRQRKTKQSNK